MHPDASLAPSWLSDLLASPAVARLGWACVHSLWQGAAVAAALAMTLWLIPRRSPAALQARYLLAAMALAALPLAAAATFFLVPAGRPAVAVAAARHGDAPPNPAAFAGETPMTAGGGSMPAVAVPARSVVRPDHRARLAAWLPLIALAWTVGAALAATRMACGWWVTRRLVARAEPLSDGRLQDRVNHWRQTMRIDLAVRLLSSAAIEAPVVVGWLKPVILWPTAMLTGMPVHDLDAIVAHELAHVRRRDALLNLLQACIDALFFHHPAAWWISAQVRAEREHCADDLAVRALEAGRAGTRLSYARALMALEERRQATALAVAANGGRLLDRIRRLAGADDAPAGAARLLAAGLAAAAVVAIVLSVTGRRTPAARPLKAAAIVAEDTNAIESLTPEEARALVERFPGVEVAIGTTLESRCLPLRGLKTLHPDTARELAAWSGPLLLSGLTTLDPATAEALAEFAGHCLVLDGLVSLDAATAEALGYRRCDLLNLDRLASLDSETAKALLWSKHSLSVPGLTSLDAATAKVLVSARVLIDLPKLTTLDAATAKVLAGHAVGLLRLSGLTTLDPETAEALAEFKGYTLDLNGLTTLDTATAEALAPFAGYCLHLDGLTTLDAATAEALAEVQCSVLRLAGLATLDSKTAKALTWFKGELQVPGLASLDAATAKVLVAARIPIDVTNFTTLNATTADLLRNYSSDLALPRLTTLDAATAAALAKLYAWQLKVDGLTTLDATTAEALAAFGERYGHSRLSLNGLTNLDVTTAKALAKSKCGTLQLLGLTSLDAEAARALADSTFMLDVPASLHEETIRALANQKPGQVQFWDVP